MAISIPELPNITTLLGGDQLHLISANTDYNIDIADFFGNIPVDTDITGGLTVSDDIVVGGSAPSGSEKLRVVGTSRFEGQIVNTSGGAVFNGTAGNTTVNATGNAIDMDRADVNYIWATTAAGYFALGTNGRAKTTGNANLLLNADQTSQFNGQVVISSGGFDVTGNTSITGQLTATNGLTVDGTSISALASLTLDAFTNLDANLFFKENGVNKWLTRYDSSANRYEIYNYTTTASALYINDADSSVVFAGGLNITGNSLHTGSFTIDNASDSSAVLISTVTGSGGYASFIDDSGATLAVIRSYESSNVGAYFNYGIAIGGTTMPADYDLYVNGAAYYNNYVAFGTLSRIRNAEESNALAYFNGGVIIGATTMPNDVDLYVAGNVEIGGLLDLGSVGGLDVGTNSRSIEGTSVTFSTLYSTLSPFFDTNGQDLQMDITYITTSSVGLIINNVKHVIRVDASTLTLKGVTHFVNDPTETNPVTSSLLSQTLTSGTAGTIQHISGSW